MVLWPGWQGLLRPRCRLSTGLPGWPEPLSGAGQQRSPALLASPGSLLSLGTCDDGPVTLGLAPAPVAPVLFVLALRQRLLQGQLCRL